ARAGVFFVIEWVFHVVVCSLLFQKFTVLLCAKDGICMNKGRLLISMCFSLLIVLGKAGSIVCLLMHGVVDDKLIFRTDHYIVGRQQFIVFHTHGCGIRVCF